MSKAIIELYVDIEDLDKQLDIIFDNGYEKVTISRDNAYMVENGDTVYFKTKYFVKARIGEEE